MSEKISESRERRAVSVEWLVLNLTGVLEVVKRLQGKEEVGRR